LDKNKTAITMTAVMIAIMLMLIVGSLANNVNAKKHKSIEDSCFAQGKHDGKDKNFDTSAEDACGNDLYREGFMSVKGNNADQCGSAEDQ
jgi:hypothetical protein